MLILILLSFLLGVTFIIFIEYYGFIKYFRTRPKSTATSYYSTYERPQITNADNPALNAFNFLFQFLFFELRDSFKVKQWIINKVYAELTELKAASFFDKILGDVKVTDINLGSYFPLINDLVVENLVFDNEGEFLEELDIKFTCDYNFNCSKDCKKSMKNYFSTIINNNVENDTSQGTNAEPVIYSGFSGFYMVLKTQILLVGKAQASVVINISELKGPVRLRFSRIPYTHWSFMFLKEPKLSLNVDCIVKNKKVPQIASLIASQIRKSISKRHTFPHYKLRVKPFFHNMFDDLQNNNIYQQTKHQNAENLSHSLQINNSAQNGIIANGTNNLTNAPEFSSNNDNNNQNVINATNSNIISTLKTQENSNTTHFMGSKIGHILLNATYGLNKLNDNINLIRNTFFMTPHISESKNQKPENQNENEKLLSSPKLLGRLNISIMQLYRLLPNLPENSEIILALSIDNKSLKDLNEESIEKYRNLYWKEYEIVIDLNGQPPGITLKEVFIPQKGNRCIIIHSIAPNSPACRYQLQKGDMIVNINGIQQMSGRQANNLLKQYRKTMIKQNDKLTIKFQRFEKPICIATEQPHISENNFKDIISYDEGKNVIDIKNESPFAKTTSIHTTGQKEMDLDILIDECEEKLFTNSENIDTISYSDESAKILCANDYAQKIISEDTDSLFTTSVNPNESCLSHRSISCDNLSDCVNKRTLSCEPPVNRTSYLSKSFLRLPSFKRTGKKSRINATHLSHNILENVGETTSLSSAYSSSHLTTFSNLSTKSKFKPDVVLPIQKLPTNINTDNVYKNSLNETTIQPTALNNGVMGPLLDDSFDELSCSTSFYIGDLDTSRDDDLFFENVANPSNNDNNFNNLEFECLTKVNKNKVPSSMNDMLLLQSNNEDMTLNESDHNSVFDKNATLTKNSVTQFQNLNSNMVPYNDKNPQSPTPKLYRCNTDQTDNTNSLDAKSCHIMNNSEASNLFDSKNVNQIFQPMNNPCNTKHKRVFSLPINVLSFEETDSNTAPIHTTNNQPITNDKDLFRKNSNIAADKLDVLTPLKHNDSSTNFRNLVASNIQNASSIVTPTTVFLPKRTSKENLKKDNINAIKTDAVPNEKTFPNITTKKTENYPQFLRELTSFGVCQKPNRFAKVWTGLNSNATLLHQSKHSILSDPYPYNTEIRMPMNNYSFYIFDGDMQQQPKNSTHSRNGKLYLNLAVICKVYQNSQPLLNTTKKGATHNKPTIVKYTPQPNYFIIGQISHEFTSQLLQECNITDRDMTFKKLPLDCPNDLCENLGAFRARNSRFQKSVRTQQPPIYDVDRCFGDILISFAFQTSTYNKLLSGNIEPQKLSSLHLYNALITKPLVENKNHLNSPKNSQDELSIHQRFTNDWLSYCETSKGIDQSNNHFTALQKHENRFGIVSMPCSTKDTDDLNTNTIVSALIKPCIYFKHRDEWDILRESDEQQLNESGLALSDTNIVTNHNKPNNALKNKAIIASGKKLLKYGLSYLYPGSVQGQSQQPLISKSRYHRRKSQSFTNLNETEINEIDDITNNTTDVEFANEALLIESGSETQKPPLVQHNFCIQQFPKGTFCMFCDRKIWLKSAFICNACGKICHKKCLLRCSNETVCPQQRNQHIPPSPKTNKILPDRPAPPKNAQLSNDNTPIKIN